MTQGQGWPGSRSGTRAPLRAGDVVLHELSGEEWILACDEEGGVVMPCGWPPTRADANGCAVIARADDEERERTLREVAGSGGPRAIAAQRQIDAEARAADAREET